MAEMPKDGRFEYGKFDPTTGAQWVYVSQTMARAHPKGRLGPALWAIVAFFAAEAGMKTYIAFAYDAPILLIGSGLQLLTALLLAIRAPWALVVALVQLGISIFGVVTDFSNTEIEKDFMSLIGLLVSCGAAFYLFEGDRPNLIYRHRFRSFRERKEDE